MCLTVRHLYFRLGPEGIWAMTLVPMFGICVFSLIISWWFSHFRIIHKPNFLFYSAFYVTFLRISVTLSGLNDLFLMAYLLSSLRSLCVWKPSRLPEKIERWMKPSSCPLSWVLGEEDGERQALLALIPTGWLVPSEGSTQSLWGFQESMDHLQAEWAGQAS